MMVLFKELTLGVVIVIVDRNSNGGKTWYNCVTPSAYDYDVYRPQLTTFIQTLMTIDN